MTQHSNFIETGLRMTRSTLIPEPADIDFFRTPIPGRAGSASLQGRIPSRGTTDRLSTTTIFH